uniref:Uncharacterized protein n=1 Tax=Anguilla anguilla TaxID=7936 RepID=A0A0E9S0Z4_ANGAN
MVHKTQRSFLCEEDSRERGFYSWSGPPFFVSETR